jgi:hypothetical protein
LFTCFEPAPPFTAPLDRFPHVEISHQKATMLDAGIHITLEKLLVIDPAVADQAELDQMVMLALKVRSWLDAVDVAVTRRSRQLYTATLSGSARSAHAAETLGAQGRRSPRQARAAAGRAGVCDRMPGFESALIDGTVSSGHVDAVADASRRLDSTGQAVLDSFADELLSAATATSVVEYQRFVRDLVQRCSTSDQAHELTRQRSKNRLIRWTDKITGMHKMLADVDPETAAKIWTALDAKLETVEQRQGNAGVPTERLLVDALVEIVTATAGDQADRRVPEMHVHVDHKTLIDGLHDQSLCELTDGTNLSVATVLRLCCEAEIIPIIIGLDGQPLDAGLSVRTANRKQRRLLRNMYSTCAHPHCTVPFDFCQIHHVVFWEHAGPTDLANLLPLCTGHHHLVHEGGWRLSMSAERVITLGRPDGSIVFSGSTCDRTRAQRSAATDPGVAAYTEDLPPPSSQERSRREPGPPPPHSPPDRSTAELFVT